MKFNIPKHLIIKWENYCKLLASGRPSEPKPTQTDYQDFLNQFNYVKGNFVQENTPLNKINNKAPE